MRILFMGTPDFSVPTLRDLIESDHDVVGVVTQPDKPKGRGKQVIETPVKIVAREHGIPVYQPIKVRDKAFIELMKTLNIDVAVVIAFGQILSKEFLAMPHYGCLNIHASLLPNYRGAGPIQWSVINGESVTGVTTMYMDSGIDTGDMLLKEEVVIEEKETGGSLHDKLSLIGGPLILKTIKVLEEGALVREPQDHEASTYAPMLDKKMGNIDWNQSAVEIERLVRGLNPWPSTYTHYKNLILKVWDSEVVEVTTTSLPGTLVEKIEDGIVIQCGKNGLLIRSLQLQGKKRMTTNDFLRGHVMDIGSFFSQSPTEEKE